MTSRARANELLDELEAYMFNARPTEGEVVDCMRAWLHTRDLALTGEGLRRIRVEQPAARERG